LVHAAPHKLFDGIPRISKYQLQADPYADLIKVMQRHPSGPCMKRIARAAVEKILSDPTHPQYRAFPDLQVVDYVSRDDRGSILIDYLGVSERQLVKVTGRMIAEGKYELAATALEWTRGRFKGNKSLDEVERLTYLKLMEKYQEFNPFKFIIYSAQIGNHTPQMESKQQTPQSAPAGNDGQ
jgi:hypothetical protein